MPECADLVKEKADDSKTSGKTAPDPARQLDSDTPSHLSRSLLPAAGPLRKFRLGPEIQGLNDPGIPGTPYVFRRDAPPASTGGSDQWGTHSLLSPYGLGQQASAGIPGRRGQRGRVRMNAIRAIHPDRHEGLWVFDEGQRSAISGQLSAEARGGTPSRKKVAGCAPPRSRLIPRVADHRWRMASWGGPDRFFGVKVMSSLRCSGLPDARPRPLPSVPEAAPGDSLTAHRRAAIRPPLCQAVKPRS